MAQKEAVKRDNSLWSVYGARYFDKLVFWRKNNSTGFTLVELLIVISILGLIGMALLTIINPIAQIQKANDAKRKADLGQIQKVLEQYYNDNGRYPYSTRTLANTCDPGSITGAATNWTIKPGPSTNCVSWGSTWDSYDTYIPKDPASPNRYVYQSPDDGQSYFLYTHLQRGTQDVQNCCATQSLGCSCPNAGSSANGGVGDGNACGTSGTTSNNSCNYGVTSPNKTP